MKRKVYFLWLILLVMIVKQSQLCAQVTIGTGSAPEKGALLQLKDQESSGIGGITATKGGFLLPRVALEKRAELYPFYQSSDTDYTEGANRDKAKKNNIGLIVYNLSIVEHEYLGPGLYQWDGESWNKLQQSPEMAKASITCDRTRINGLYYKGVSLNSSNFMVIYLNVVRKGSYSIIAKSGNGYNFQATGTFDNTGPYSVTLEGIGTPSVESSVKGISDLISIFLNDEQVCSSSNINVLSTQVSYEPRCAEISSTGIYWEGTSAPADNAVLIPISVDNAGTASITTNTVNGLTFIIDSATSSIDINTKSIKLKPVGMPTSAGNYTYVFTANGANPITCSFNIAVKTTLGTFNNPAKRCLEIHQKDATLSDGEYWIQDGKGGAVKTFCDMTNGGYTLLWSYSEDTNYNNSDYNPKGSMVKTDNKYHLNYDWPHGTITTASGGGINYNYFRLGSAAMQNAATSTLPLIKVRITNNATDMNDQWALNNYGIITPTTIDMNPILSTTNYIYYVPLTGKIFGQDWIVTNNTRTYAGATLGDAAFCTSWGGYGTHWNFSNNISANNNIFTVKPAVPTGEDGTLFPSNLDNMFGYFGESNQPNHHWGKCGGPAGSETSFATKTCQGSTRVPHTSINAGKGRILQWFVK